MVAQKRRPLGCEKVAANPLFFGGGRNSNGLVNFVAFEDVEVPRGFG